MPKGFLAWHPKVHEHFGERLFFFLLAMKSRRGETLKRKIRELFERCNVPTEPGGSGYCSYALLGDFDHLLRVWLPPNMDIRFVDAARELLAPDVIMQFSVQRVVMDWRFTDPPPQDAIDDLDLTEVATLQRREEMSRDLTASERRLACWVSDEFSSEKEVMIDPIKAFICLKAPDNSKEAQLESFQAQFVGFLTNAVGIKRCTVHRGVGFTWLLAKIVAADFRALSRLLDDLGERFHGLQVSTSTYAVACKFVEGDSIRTSGDAADRVYQFWPELRHHEITRTADAERLRRVHGFIEEKVFGVKLESRERTILRKMLAAVLSDDPEAANETLISPTIRLESELRARVLALVGRRSGGEGEALEFLQCHGHEIRVLDTMPLGPSLLLARREIESRQPGSAVIEQFSVDVIARLTRRRNKSMQGVPINLDEEWREMAEYLLFLFRMQPAFATALEHCLRQPLDQG